MQFDDDRRHLLQRADALERSLNLTEEAMIRTEHLVMLMEEVANDLYQLAEDWESIDPQRAERWRAQERQIRALSDEFKHHESSETEEAKSIITALRQMASGARAANVVDSTIPEGALRQHAGEISMEVFLDTDDTDVAEQVFQALDGLLPLVGCEPSKTIDIIRGSIWKRARAKVVSIQALAAC